MTMVPEPSHEEPKEPKKTLVQFQNSMRRLTISAARNLHQAQQRYKRSYDRREQPVGQPKVGDWVYVRRETTEEDSEGMKHR